MSFKLDSFVYRIRDDVINGKKPKDDMFGEGPHALGSKPTSKPIQ